MPAPTAPAMSATRTFASRIMRATAAAAPGESRSSNNRTMDWADMLEEFNRRNVGMGDNPSVAGRIAPEAGRRVRQIDPGFRPAVRIRLRPEAVEAIGKFIRTMRPGGSMPFDENVARDTVLRIIRYYHPQIEGLGNLGSWLSDTIKGKDSPLSKVIAVAAPIVGGVVGGPAGAAAGAAFGGALASRGKSSGGQQQPQVIQQPQAVQQPAAPINPFATLGPFLPSVPPTPLTTVQTQPQIIAASGGEGDWKKYIPLMIGGGVGLLVLTMVLKK
ncbi:MAG: hypothetical protein IT436_05200 [Phycisphaerales bacterium]|nr:hypothetical protein [Phycisphaerales bacterium]